MSNYSGKEIIRAGEMLIEDEHISNSPKFEQAMQVLSFWRFSHEEPLEAAFKLVQDVSLKVDKKAIFAKRLKRYASIVNKLKRFKDMKLKNMQDIGGCRAIVSTPKKVDQIVRELRKRKEFKGNNKLRFKNYIKHPKPDGYRGYHLIGQFNDISGNKRNIEVQIRTALQHDWATAIEIVDLFTDQALKSNRGEENWKQFFRSVSEQFAIMEDIHLFTSMEIQKRAQSYLKEISKSEESIKSCINSQKLAEKLDVVKNFNAFAHSLKIVDNRLEKNFFDGYVLLQVDTAKSIVNAHFFPKDQSKDAETAYVNAEKKAAEGKNVVVALVSTTAVGGIREAYPNYFADSTDFLKHLLIITQAPVQKRKGLFSRIFGS